MNLITFLVLLLIFLSGVDLEFVRAQQTRRPFRVADEIALTMFGTVEGGPPELHFSPDGTFFAVWTERGRLDLNRPEDSLRFYRVRDVRSFLTHSDESQPPLPVWVITRATYKQQRSIESWRWLADSTGVAFLERTSAGTQRLVFADVPKKKVEPLTSEIEDVTGFNARDRQHYIYTAADTSEWQNWRAEMQKPVVVGTGHPIDTLLFADDPNIKALFPSHGKDWAVIDGKRLAAKYNGVLSPDGHSVITALPVTDVPQSWEALYLSPSYNPYAAYGYQIHAGHHDLRPGDRPPYEYVDVNLMTGAIKKLTHAPNSEDAGWFSGGEPSWSTNGKRILLPHTFTEPKNNLPSRPCVAVVDLSSNSIGCVETLKTRTGGTTVEEGYHHIKEVRFIDGDGKRIVVTFRDQDYSPGYTEYQQDVDGKWTIAKQGKGEAESGHEGLEIEVKQGIDEPPKLVATTHEKSLVLWDPNPQLKDFDLGEATVYTWSDKQGRRWKGGLYKPVGYTPGNRYPLVVQTHGFPESEFRPSGIFTTAFAARELAAAGIMVLQIALGASDTNQDCGDDSPTEEGPCAISLAEVPAKKLVADGLVDPDNIGIIGFSRTCFQAMELLTAGSLRMKAASITDGVMFDYFQYLISVDLADNGLLKESSLAIGAPPFGEGLQRWVKQSPGFNLDKVNTPLLVVGEGRDSLFWMWQPYAGLRALHKPTELVLLNTDEHVLTNPAMRLASQGGSVDWFRFWLQGYEDPNPAKSEQYKRWRELRKMQAENERH